MNGQKKIRKRNTYTSFIVGEDLLAELDQFVYDNRLKSRSSAIRKGIRLLLEQGLKNHKGD